jgi:hypothetical protein
VVASSKTDELIGFCGVKEIEGVLDFGYFLREKLGWSKVERIKWNEEIGYLYVVNM